MRRVFFSNLLFVVLLNLLVKPLWVLGIDREAQNALGREAYGLYFALFNLSYMFNILVDMGLSYYNSRAVAGSPSLLKELLPQAVVLKLMLSAVYFMASVVIALVWGISGFALGWLLVLCFNQILQSFTIYLRTNLSAIQHYRLDSLVSVADKALMIVLFGTMLWIPSLRGSFTFERFVLGQTACFTATLLLAIWFNVRYAGRVRWSVRREALRNVWNRSYPYAVLVLFMSVYAKADGILLERLVNASEAGVYAYGYRMFDATNQFGYLFAMLLMPIFSRMLAGRENVQPLAGSGLAALFMFTVGAAAVSVVYRFELIHLLYRDADGYCANVFAAVMCALPGSALVYVYGTLLAANANIRHLNAITAIGALLNVGLNVLVIPVYGALGAAAVAVITHSAVGLTEAFFCARLLNFKNDARLAARLVAFGLLTFALFFAARVIFQTWWYGMAAGCALSALVAWATRLVHPQQLVEMARLRAAR